MAGVSRLQYANEIRIIRVMCSGRVDLEFILRGFSNGQDGVFIGGCRLNECNYVTQGNYDALGNVYICKMIMAKIGLNPDRLRVQFMNASDGILLADTIDKFSKSIKEIGPIGKGEGLDIPKLRMDLKAISRLVPYIRLVERERLRVPIKSEEEYKKHFTSQEVEKLVDELIFDKFELSQILLLLQQKAHSTAEIANALGLSPSEISRHINNSSRHGLVRYDESMQRYAIA